ncbi:hypothetical protein KY285_026613 [Solanum tuberosum]|nr:hypothetical protein KY285_026613 [Solanum tuberosum]
MAICKSTEIPVVSQTAMRLKLFPFSLIGEKLAKLNEAFLEKFFPEAKELQMKDEIGAHKKLPGEKMHDTWWRFYEKW